MDSKKRIKGSILGRSATIFYLLLYLQRLKFNLAHVKKYVYNDLDE